MLFGFVLLERRIAIPCHNLSLFGEEEGVVGLERLKEKKGIHFTMFFTIKCFGLVVGLLLD